MDQEGNYRLRNDNMMDENGWQCEPAYSELQWALDNLHWTDHPSQSGQHTAPSDSEQLSTRDFKTAICELQSLITPGVRQLVQSSYPLHSNGYNFQEQSAYELYNQDEVRQYEYELHSQDEVRRYENGLHDQDEVRQYEYGLHDQDEVRGYEDGLHGRDEVYQYDSPSMQAMEQHIEGPKSRDGQPKRNISPIEPIIRARIPSVGPVTGDVVANEFTALGSPSKPDREYYITKDGKRRLKNLPGPLRREADLHIHYLTEQELREIRSNYDAHPSQTFQNPNGGTLHKTIAEDGRVTMELAKRVRVSNEEHDKWVELQEKSGKRVRRRKQQPRTTEAQKAYLERNKKANEHFKTRKRPCWVGSKTGFRAKSNRDDIEADESK